MQTLLSNDNNQLEIQAVGMFDDEQIKLGLGKYSVNPVYANFLKGKTNLQANLIIPFKLSESPGKKIKLRLSSNLKGMQVSIPEPFGKSGAETQDFSFAIDLTGGLRDLAFDYGNYHALLQASASDTSFDVIRGSVGLNEKAVLPNEQGYRFTGHLPEFDWNEWKSVFYPANPENSLFGRGGDSSLLFLVNIANLKLFDQHIKDVDVHASKTALNWFVHLSSPQVEGDITLPPNFSRMPIIANLKKLHINVEKKSTKAKSVQGGYANLNPLEFPLLDLKVEDLAYNKIQLGKVSLQTEKIEDGQKIKSLSLQPKGSKINVNGSWIAKDGKQKTQIDVKIDAKKFGETLDGWDFQNLVGDGTGNLNLDLAWPGNPTDFSFDTIEGKFNFKLKDASLLDFNMGAAKLFTVLLPRRLLLDFKDVPKSGLYFDTMSGEYTIQSGKAFTNGVKLRGPAADIDLAGKIGLASKTFDQVVTVNRRLIGDTLPIVGSVIPGAGPIVGGGIFVFKKLFEKQIDNIFSVQYTVEGSWGKPVIKEVEKQTEGGKNRSSGESEGILSE